MVETLRSGSTEMSGSAVGGQLLSVPLMDAVHRMRAMAIAGLRRMFLPEQRLFCHCIRRTAKGDVVEGVSRRYTAIALIGVAKETDADRRAVLHGQDIREVAAALLRDVDRVTNLGDVSLILWAAAEAGIEDVSMAVSRLRELDPTHGNATTVEVAWALSACGSAGKNGAPVGELAGAIADRLIRTHVCSSGMFSHWPAGATAPWIRSHVCCFADLVYPIQALAAYHASTGDERAAEIACRSADRMCALQGEGGQWWWHFDVRTGRVIERYPVYAVHQDSMGPMALLDLRDACGTNHAAEIERGFQWLLASPERGDSLIDKDAGLIWRKVARKEPGKLSRGVQALTTRIHPALRVPGLAAILRPGSVDYECRPYHLGWLLYAFSRSRVAA